MSKPVQPRPLLHAVLAELEAVGIVEFEHTGDAVLVSDRRGLHSKASKTLEPYTRYLCASLARRAGERLTFAEARKLLGFCGHPHTPGPILQKRDRLMSQAGFDIPWEEGITIPTLTIEELEARFASPASGGGEKPK